MAVGAFGWPTIAGPAGSVWVRGTRQAELLALLTARAEEVVSREAIVDEIWDGQRSSLASLRVAISRLRQQFVDVVGNSPIGTARNGYLLDVDASTIDIHRYKSVALKSLEAHALGDHPAVIDSAVHADSLWVGRPFDGIDDVRSVSVERDKLDDLRIRLAQACAVARLHLGDAASARTILESLTEREPYREEPWALLAIALAHERRPVEGLGIIRRFRGVLRDELGLSPSPAIESLEQELLESRDGESVGWNFLDNRAHRSESRQGRRHAADFRYGGRPVAAIAPVVEPRPRTTAVLGREAELAQLDELADRCERQGELLIVDIIGEAGIGKTALLRSWLACQHSRGREVRYGAAGPEGAIPFEAVLQALPDGLRGDRSTAAVSRAVLLDRLVETLVARALNRTIVLALEDAHFFDLATVAFVRHLAARAENVPLFIVRTRRPVPSTDRSVIAEHHVELGPLADGQIASIARSASPPSACQRVREIVELAAGHPGFAIELANHAELRLPRTALELASQRRARVDGLGLDIVDLVAIAGRPLGITELAELLYEDPPTVALAAAAAVEQRVLIDEDGLAFSHDLYRSGTLDAVPALRRRALHARFAKHLRHRSVRPTRECAKHALAAGEIFGPGLRTLVADAAVGTALGVEPEAALQLCDRVPDEPPHTPEDDAKIALAKGIAGASLGHGLEAQRELHRALELGRRGSDHGLLTEIVFAHKLFGVPIDDALALMTEAVLPVLDRGVDDIWRLRAVWATASYAGDDCQLATDMERRGTAIAEGIGTQSARAIAAHTSVISAFICGRSARKREELATVGLRLAADGGDPLLEHLHLGALASARMAQGDLVGTLALHDRLLALPATQALVLAKNLVEARAATISICQGRFEEAEQAIHEVWNDAVDAGRSDASLTFAAQLFVLRWTQERLPELLGQIDSLHDIASDVPDSFDAALAVCHAAVGEAGPARRILDRLSLHQTGGRPDLVTITLATSARWQLGDRVDPAWAAMVEPFIDEHAAADLSSAVTFGPVRRTLALIAASNGDWDRGRALLVEAHAACTKHGHVAFARLVADELAVLEDRARRFVVTTRA